MFACGCDPKQGDSTNTNEIPSTEIIRLLANGESLIIKGKTITGLLNFTMADEAVWGTTYISSEICFIDCSFKDEVTAFGNKSGFSRCVFERNIVFSDCRFEKNVDFNNAVFRLDANFDGTQFMENANFANAVFFMGASFRKSFFKRDCIFHFARFNNITKFIESYFYGYTDYSQIFSGSILDFTASKFHGETLMSYSMLLGDVIFSNCNFIQQMEFKENAVLGEINFKSVEGLIPDITNNKMFNR